MSSNTITTADRLTFAKLFSQRSDTSFARVLRQCFTTEQLIAAFNRKSKTSLELDESSGRIVVRDESMGDFQQQIDLFAAFAWKHVFPHVQQQRAV